MGLDRDFLKRLMEASGVSDDIPSEEMAAITRKIARQEEKLKWTKRQAIFVWVGVGLAPTIAILIGMIGGGRFPVSIEETLAVGFITATIWVLPIAIVVYFVRRHFLNQYRIEAAMLRIAAQLAKTKMASPEE